MMRTIRSRLLAIGSACALAGCGSKPNASAEKQDTSAAVKDARAPGSPVPVVVIDAGRISLDGVELVSVADIPLDAETIGALLDGLAKKKTDASATDLRLIFRAHTDTPAFLINRVLGTAKTAGYGTISLCPLPAQPNETCSQIVLAR